MCSKMASTSKVKKGLSADELQQVADSIMEKGLETDSDFSDAESEHSDHESMSEQEGSDIELENWAVPSDVSEQSEEMDVERESNYFYGKNRHKWSKNPPATGRTRATNLISHLPGLRGESFEKQPAEPIVAWKCFINDQILEKLLIETNARITYMAANYSFSGLCCQFTSHVDKVELSAFFGLLYLAGVFKSNNEDLQSLFATDGTGRDIFRATMSLKRFYFLLTALRFDDRSTREERINNGDPLAPISEVYKIFIDNCKSNYSCGEYLTVDEMLIAFRGRCKFRMYLKNKPDKYGLKMQCLCDARTHYLLNAFVYTGKNHTYDRTRKLGIPTLDVMRLIQPVANTNRNITGDNWFTSYELITELRRQGLTYVGTIKKIRENCLLRFCLIKTGQLIHLSLDSPVMKHLFRMCLIKIGPFY